MRSIELKHGWNLSPSYVVALFFAVESCAFPHQGGSFLVHDLKSRLKVVMSHPTHEKTAVSLKREPSDLENSPKDVNNYSPDCQTARRPTTVGAWSISATYKVNQLVL